MQKKHLTKEDAEKLETKQSELLKIHGVFEELTRKVQRLVGLADISSTQFQPSFKELLAGVTPDGDRPGVVSAQPSVEPGGKPGEQAEGQAAGGEAGKPGEQLAAQPSKTTDDELDKSTLVSPEQLAMIPEREKEEEDSDLETTTSDDMLPRVVVCGVEDQMPRIIVCDEKKRAPIKPRKLCGYKNKDVSSNAKYP